MSKEIPKGQEAEFEKIKAEGYVNPDGSSYDPESKIYTRATDDKTPEHTIANVPPDEAFAFRKEGYKPLKEAAKAAVEGAKAAGGVEVAATTGEAIAKQRSIVELEGLKNKLGTNMAALGETFSLEGQKITGDFVFDNKFDLSSYKLNIAQKFAAIFTADKVAAAANIMNANLKPGEIPIKAENVSAFLSDTYANATVKYLMTAFAIAYPNYVAFKNSLGADKSYKFTYELGINKNSVFTPKVKPDADPANQFLPEYTAYDKMNPKPVELTPSEVKLNERAKNFKNSGVGRFLGAMGVINVGVAVEGETKEQAEARETKAYAEALNGSNFIAQFFIYFMGGSAMLADGGASIKDTLSGLDPKFQAVVKGIEAKVPKMMAKMAEDPKYRTPEDELEAAKTEPVKAEDFAKILSGEKAQPEKTIKLSDKYDAGETGLTITLKDGAEMIIPEGTSIRIKDKSEPERAEDKKPRSFTSTITVTGELPVGTKFNSKVVFEKPGDKAATAKKEAEKPAPDTNEKPAS